MTLKQVVVACAVTLLPALLSAATVPNLGSVEKAIVYPEGKQIFDEQMRGLPSSREFGELPPALDSAAFIRWLAPDEDAALLTLTGAKAWGSDSTYIGIACFAYDAADAGYAKQYQDTDCSESSNERHTKKLYLGVFKWQDQRLQPVARTAKPLADDVSWANSDLDAPAMAEDAAELPPQNYKKLDLAPYKISADATAFGVRAGFNEGYSGGGAFFEALQLYMVKGDQIVNILSEPMYFYKDVAGDWHRDGTRSHDITEGKNILKVLKTQTDGYYDLQIKSMGSKWHKDFVWSVQQGRYVAKR